MPIERKVFSSKVKSYNDESLTIDHFISVEVEDRSKDVVRANGMVLNGMPAVLKSHGFDPDTGTEPIAKPLALKIAHDENGNPGILATTQYYDGSHLTPPDNTGRKLYEKARDGFMDKFSIGFIPMIASPKQGGGRDIKKWECLEYSQVGVPDNPSAKVPTKDANAIELKFAIKPKQQTDGNACETTIGDDVYVNKLHDGDLFVEDIDILAACVEVKEAISVEMKPYANEHACRIEEPISGATTRRVNGAREHEGKKYDVIYQKHDDGKMHEQAYRYPKKTWTSAQAKKHCSDHKGIKFEAAKAAQKDAPHFTLDESAEEKQKYNCECIECGHKMSTDKHCKDVPCPKCGGTMRRAERPGPGQKLAALNKSISDRVAYDLAFDVMRDFWYALLGELASVKHDEKSVKALMKEFVEVVSPWAIYFSEVMSDGNDTQAESVTKWKDQIDRKTYDAVDDAVPSPDPEQSEGAPKATPTSHIEPKKAKLLFKFNAKGVPQTSQPQTQRKTLPFTRDDILDLVKRETKTAFDKALGRVS